MKTIQITSEPELDFAAASKMSDAVARSLHGDEVVCLSWYDSVRDQQSPAHACECRIDGRDVPGYIGYAQSRGGQLRVVVNDGTFVFCYRSVDDFVR